MIHNVLKQIGGGILIRYARLGLKNKNFSLIANNCIGGIISHSLGEQFRSPTVNLFIRTEDYFRFLENFDEALSADVTEIKTDRIGVSPVYPLGEIHLHDGSTVQIHFMHYVNFYQARQKWIERSKRIDKNNLFVLMELGIETTPEYVERFDRLPFKNKAVITNAPFSKLHSTIFIDIFGPDYKPGTLVRLIPHSFHRHIELFDYRHWLNTGQIRHAKFYKKFIQ